MPHSLFDSSPTVASSDAAKARLVATMDATSDFVGIVRPNGSIEYLNRAGRTLVGMTETEEVSDISAAHFYTPETLALITGQGFPAAIANGSWSGDGEVITLFGAKVAVSIVMVAHPSQQPGEAPFFSAVMRDMRERNHAAEELARSSEALARSEARLRRAIDGGLDAFMALTSVRDASGTIVDFDVVEASPRAAELVQVPRDELIGRRMCELFPVHRTSGLFERWVAVTRSNTAMEWEFETLDPRMRASWIQVQAVPLDRGIALTLRDISERKRAEASLRLMLDVTQEVANAPDAVAALEALLHKMCDATQWDYGEAWMVNGASYLARGPVWHVPGDVDLAHFAAETASLHLTSGMDLPGATWATGRMKSLKSLSGPMIDQARRAAMERARLSAGVAVPVTAANNIVAIVSFLVRDPHKLDDSRLELLTAMTTQIGAIVGHKVIENTLARERAFLGSVLDSLSESVTVCNPDGRLTLLNRAARRALGLPIGSQPLPERWLESRNVLLPDGETPFAAENLPHARVLRDGGSVHDVESILSVPGRASRTMLANANLVIGPDGTLFGSVCASRDVTSARKAEADLRESESRFRGVLETVRSLAVTLDVDGRITFANDALLAVSGRTREEVLGQSWFELFAMSGGFTRESYREAVLAGNVPAHIENDISAHRGERRLVAWDTTILYDSSGTATGTASIGRDITEQRALEARLAEMSENDDLTGLANRRGFRRMADQQLKVGRRTGRRGAILFIDLDYLKPINDIHGHAAGDEAIRATAEVLRHGIREADLIGRLGGDEFAIFATDVATLGEAEVLATRFRDRLAESNRSAEERGRPFAVSFTIGVALVENDDDLDSALARADEVLNSRKAGRGRSSRV